MGTHVRKKGVVMLITLMVMAVLLILTGVYFTTLLTEKRSADSESKVMQALSFAEAGAYHALAELRRRIRSDLSARVQAITQASTVQAYITANNSLSFLRDYAYAAGDPQFTLANNTASLSLAALAIAVNTTIPGNYTCRIDIQENGPPVNSSAEVFTFPFKFQLEADGNVSAPWYNASSQLQNTLIHRRVRLGQGTFNVTVRRDTFSKYALFTFHHRTQSGTTVWFTGSTNFTGPVHTNERFSFANNPSAHFTQDVTQYNQTARFYNNGSSILLNAASNPPRDVPIFDTTFTRGSDMITMNTTITQADVKAQALGTLSEPGSNGIYIPNDGSAATGGIYVRGNCVITTSVGSGNSANYTITQGAVTNNITVDYANNRTIVAVGGNQTVYNGLPDGMDDEGTLIYAKDNITGFNGTIQRNSAVTVTSERDMVVTSNVLYEQYNAGPPVNATGYSNILSMLSWGGNVRIGTAAPDNITICGVVMAPNGVFTVDNYDQGVPRGTATLLGGVITDYYGAFGQFSGVTQIHGYGRNFVYDARMLSGMSPPYFPYLNRFNSTVGSDGNGVEDLNKPLTWQDEGA